MRLKYFTSTALAELKTTAQSDLARYSGPKPFLDRFFKATGGHLVDSRVDVPALPALKLPSGDKDHDLENAIKLHTALRNLTPAQAADERLWAWMAHDPYWDYMRVRWPADEWKKKGLTPEETRRGFRYVLEHYFAPDARALVRHGIARLWWFGKATFDEASSDPYRRTKLMLRTADSRQSIMERQYWRNPEVLAPLLDRVEHWEKKNFSFYQPRERFRQLCKDVNAWGGTMLLDSLAAKDVAALVDAAARELKSASTT